MTTLTEQPRRSGRRVSKTPAYYPVQNLEWALESCGRGGRTGRVNTRVRQTSVWLIQNYAPHLPDLVRPTGRSHLLLRFLLLSMVWQPRPSTSGSSRLQTRTQSSFQSPRTHVLRAVVPAQRDRTQTVSTPIAQHAPSCTQQRHTGDACAIQHELQSCTCDH